MSKGAKADNVRAAILREAIRLFADQGYGATTVQEIATAAGVSKQLLIYHYSSKDQLRRAVLDELLTGWETFLPRLSKAIEQDGPSVDAALDWLHDYFAGHPHVARYVIRALITPGSMLASDFRETVEPGLVLTAQTLAGGDRTAKSAESMISVFALLFAVIDAVEYSEDSHVSKADLRALATVLLKQFIEQ